MSAAKKKKTEKKTESYEEFRERVLAICAREAPDEPEVISGNVEREIMLYNTDPAKNTDKVYKVAIIRTGSGRIGDSGTVYNVTGNYGRRGGKMTEEKKTDRPVALGTAISIYNDLVREKKQKKGYTENISGM